MKYYQRIKDIREDHDKTQSEIAKVLGTTQSYYAQYENGKRDMPLYRAVILARYYNVSLDYLTGLVDTPRKLE